MQRSYNQTGRSALGIIVVILALATLILAYFVLYLKEDDSRESDATSEKSLESQLMNQGEVSVMSLQKPSRDASILEGAEDEDPHLTDVVFDYEGRLFNFSEIDGTKGEVMFGDKDGAFVVFAAFEGLPDPKRFGEGYYYQGWLVRREPFHLLNLGKIENLDAGIASQIYVSMQDWSDHDYYVLSLEQDDGNLAPSEEHVMAGIIIEK